MPSRTSPSQGIEKRLQGAEAYASATTGKIHGEVLLVKYYRVFAFGLALKRVRVNGPARVVFMD